MSKVKASLTMIVPDLKEVFWKTKFALVAFLVPLFVRSIPEILAGPYPIGYDSITAYIPFMRDWVLGRTGPQFDPVGGSLLFAIFGSVFSLGGLDPVAIVKSAGPILYGLLGISEYLFCRRVLTWSQQKGLLLVLVSATYFVSLRISWDLLRNTLGLSFMLLTLVVGSSINSKQKTLAFAGLMLATGLAHLLVGTIVISITLLRALVGTRIERSLIATTLPSIALVVISIVQLSAGGLPIATSGQTINAFDEYAYVGYIFLPLIPLAILGYRSLRSTLLKFWLFVCAMGVILGTTPLAISSEIVSPERWAFMMFLPLTAYAVEGFYRIKGSGHAYGRYVKHMRWVWISFLLVLAGSYVALPASQAFVYYRFFVPTSMMQSTIPVEESPNVIATFQWLSSNMQPGSVLVMTDPMYGWARQYYSGNQTVLWFHTGETLQAAIQATVDQGYSTVYTVWWSDGLGWYGQPDVPSGSVLEYQAGHFGVFLFSP